MLFGEGGEVVVGLDRGGGVGGVVGMRDLGLGEDGMDMDGGDRRGIMDMLREEEREVVGVFVKRKEVEIGVELVEFVREVDDGRVEFVSGWLDVVEVREEGLRDRGGMENNEGVGGGWCERRRDGMVEKLLGVGGLSEVVLWGVVEVEGVGEVGERGLVEGRDLMREVGRREVEGVLGVGEFMERWGEVGLKSGEDWFE